MENFLDNSKKIYSVMSSVLGKKVTGVVEAFPAAIYLDFGNRTKNQRGFFRGEYRLIIFDTWRILKHQTVLATSNDPSEKILSGLNIFLEKELEAVDVVDAELNTVFKFPNEIKIAAFNISHLGEENAGLVTLGISFPS